jgi:hypothetical protein
MFSGLRINNKTAAQIRRSPEVTDELRRRAERIRSAAGDDDFEVDVRPSRSRARVSVRTATFRGRYLEATEQTLSRALDAGRD